MAIDIRSAESKEVNGIANVKKLVWPDETTIPELVTSAMTDANHVTFVAVAGGVVVGFIDGFINLTENRKQRWNVDLLAVHPEYRGLGLGVRLVKAAVTAGQQKGATFSQALIQVGNIASQRTFSKCGFQPEITVCNLYVSSGKVKKGASPVKGLLLVPVITFNYRGLWLENNFDINGFTAAQVVQTNGNWQQVSAVIPVYSKESNMAAVTAGYSKVGQYQYWTMPPGATSST